MARDDRAGKLDGLMTSPWPTLLGGLSATLLALILAQSSAEFLKPIRVLLLVAGVIAAGFGARVRFRRMNWNVLEDRLNTAGVMALGAVAVLLAKMSLDESWDSIALMLQVLIVVALVGA